jgi:hypothetical protein
MTVTVKYLTPYRIASALLVLFCAGHTAGGMLSQKNLGPAADAVFVAMKSVHFNISGSSCTWYGFWFGFGLIASVFLLFSAVAAWQLDKVGPESWSAVSLIAWALVVSHVCNAILSWAYFFAFPGILATAVAILLAVGTWRKGKVATVHRAV